MSSNFTIGKSMDQILKDEADTIDKIMKKEAYPKVIAIKREIYGIFTVIVKNAFQEVFTDMYGSGYDVQSLDKAVKIMSGSSLIPDFYFEKNDFHFNEELERFSRKFNENSRKYASFRDLEGPEFYLGEILQDYEDNSDSDEDSENEEDYEDIYDDIMYEYLDMTPVNKILVKGTRFPLDETYKIARDKALVAFNTEYNSQIKPRIYKKYGIKI